MSDESYSFDQGILKVAKKSIFRDGIDDVLDLVDTELPAYYKKPYINLPFEEMPVS